MEPQLAFNPTRAKISSGSVLVLAFLFVLFFNTTKQDPALAAVNPFADDPYDAMGSFGIQAALFLAILALLRVFHPKRSNIHPEERFLLLLRVQIATVLAVGITLVSDTIALIRHVSLWAGSPAGFRLVALLIGFGLLVVLIGIVVYRQRRQAGLPHPSDVRSAGLVIVAGLAVLAIYPEHISDSVVGALFTVLVGDVLLFVPLAMLVVTLLPYSAPTDTDLATGKRFPWAWVVGGGFVLGLLAFTVEAFSAGTSPDIGQGLFVATVYVGLEISGAILGFAVLRRPMGLVRTRP